MTVQADQSRGVADEVNPNEKAALWAAFSSAPEVDARLDAWLRLLASRIPDVVAAGAFRRGADDPAIALMARFGEFTTPEEAMASASRGFARAVTLVRSVGPSFHLIAQPDRFPEWVIVFECSPTQSGALQQALDEIRWGAGWLVACILEAGMAGSTALAARLAVLSRALHACGQAREVVGAASGLAKSLVDAYPGMLVSVGVYRHEVLTLAARQGEVPDVDPADADERRESIVRSALDQRRTVLAGALPDPDPAAEAAAMPDEGPRVAAIPLVGTAGNAGVLLCERPAGPALAAEELATLEQLAELSGPIIEMKPVSRPSPVTRERRMLVGLFGPVRYRWKLAAVGLLAAVLVLLGATGEYQAQVRVTVEGAPPHRIEAPFAAKLAEVRVRVGDAVRRGQVLARFDDTELQLERVKLTAERDRLLPALRDARDLGDRASVDNLAERQREIDGRLAAVDERLSRLQVESPVDGVVQAAVAAGAGRGNVPAGASLFTIAQMEGYRLTVDAASGDRSLLREGQSGLARFGAGSAVVPFTITRIAGGEGSPPKVEAQMQRLGLDVTPGAEGVGEIDFGTRKLVWIWWRRLQGDDLPAQ